MEPKGSRPPASMMTAGWRYQGCTGMEEGIRLTLCEVDGKSLSCSLQQCKKCMINAYSSNTKTCACAI
eukprot:scaffold64279_cov19-Tisochrysis_lutea.AAC.3